MIQRVGEAIVLRVWPFQEADLLVSLFMREQGRVKGVARHALRSRRRFGLLWRIGCFPPWEIGPRWKGAQSGETSFGLRGRYSTDTWNSRHKPQYRYHRHARQNR